MKEILDVIYSSCNEKINITGKPTNDVVRKYIPELEIVIKDICTKIVIKEQIKHCFQNYSVDEIGADIFQYVMQIQNKITRSAFVYGLSLALVETYNDVLCASFDTLNKIIFKLIFLDIEYANLNQTEKMIYPVLAMNKKLIQLQNQYLLNNISS